MSYSPTSFYSRKGVDAQVQADFLAKITESMEILEDAQEASTAAINASAQAQSYLGGIQVEVANATAQITSVKDTAVATVDAAKATAISEVSGLSTAATLARDGAVAAQGTATTKATEAATSASSASASASAAASSKTLAETAKTAAEAANTAAQTAKTAAEGSQTAAATSATNAATSATAAATSATTASTGATTATTKAGEASTSATNAATSATNAATSATTATTGATTATTKAGEASTSATAAQTAKTAAETAQTAAATSATNAATSATNAATSATTAATYAASYPFSFRNRIINGDMRVDQRNNGVAVTVSGTYIADRFNFVCDVGAVQCQRFSNAAYGPNPYALGVAVTSTGTPTGSQRLDILTRIEGQDVRDLRWGSPQAKTVVLSFAVNASVAGTYHVLLTNSATNRSYPASYTVSVANTWETKTITIPGDTTVSTWLKDNGAGILVVFVLATGPTNVGTANTWQTGLKFAGSGQVNLCATNANSFFVTDIQLECGTAATAFERRPIGTELSLCQRYYEKGVVQVNGWGAGGSLSATVALKATKRASPTITVTNSSFGNVNATPNSAVLSDGSILIYHAAGGAAAEGYFIDSWAASAEL